VSANPDCNTPTTYIPLLKVCLSNLPKNVAQNAPQNENKQTNFGTMGWGEKEQLTLEQRM